MIKEMFKDLEPKHLNKIAGGFMTTALLPAGTLLFNQFGDNKPFSFTQAVLGFLLWVWLFWMAAMLMQAGARRKQTR